MRPQMLALFLALSLLAQNGPAARQERWQQDLREFAALLKGTNSGRVAEVPPGQKDLRKLYPRLDADLAALEADIPTLRDGELHLRLQRIMAGAHVAHNTVHLASPPQVLPVRVTWLADGPVVVSAASEHRRSLGARLIRMGPLTAEQLLDALEPYVSYETAAWKRVMAGDLIRNGNLLNLLGLTRDGRVDLTLEGADGPFTLSVPLMAPATPLENLPQAMPKLHDYYGSRYLADSNTLYIQYNRCADDPAQSFAEFAGNVLSQIDETRAQRVVVDLRHNSGGNSNILQPLVQGLAKRRKTIGAPVVLIGPQTFSSAVMNANQLKADAKAILVGEATGGWLGGYGESPTRRLKNSGLPVQWTIKHFGSKREVQPTLAVAASVADLRAGRDPVLDAALHAPR